jgi:hypothetical protein
MCGRTIHFAERFAITGDAPVIADWNLDVIAETVCMSL